MQNLPCSVSHILGRYSAFSSAPNPINQTAAIETLGKKKKSFPFFNFLCPRGFEESIEGCHCSAVFNVNQNVQTWVTCSLAVFFLPPPRPDSRIVTRSKIASYTRHFQDKCDHPTFVCEKLAVFACLWGGFSSWNVCDINISRVSSFAFVLVKRTMKIYFWVHRMFFFYIGGWSMIRRSLFVDLCQSILEQHNEQETAAECRWVNADLKCKALRAVKRTRNVQGPTLSIDAIEKSRM